MTTGRFIVIEGPDGTGKSTLARALAAALGAELTMEPTAGFPRSTVYKAPWRVAALAFANDRALHTAAVIQPALAQGRDVVCDRYALSGMVYALARAAGDPADRCDYCAGRGESPKYAPRPCPICQGLGTPDWEWQWLREIEATAAIPDLTLVLSVPTAIAQARMTGRAADAYDADTPMQQRVRRLYAMAGQLAAGPVVEIESAGSPDATLAAALESVVDMLSVPGRAPAGG